MANRRSIAGSRILITGASQGIGKALAQQAASAGGRVLAVARSAPLLDDLVRSVRQTGGIIEVLSADVTQPRDREKMREAAGRHFGGLDILINNAGVGATGHFADVSAERLRRIMEVNFFGLTETTRVLLPVLKQGTRPAIVNVSSIAGKRGIPARSEYCASKFAVIGFSEALRAELAAEGIHVLVVCPGLTRTNFGRNLLENKALVPLEHDTGMTADEVARQTLYALERGRNEICLTFKGRLVVLVNRFFPWFADYVVRRKVRTLFAEEIAARRHGTVTAIDQNQLLAP